MFDGLRYPSVDRFSLRFRFPEKKPRSYQLDCRAEEVSLVSRISQLRILTNTHWE